MKLEIAFRTDDYVASTGKEPRGRGSWAFSTVRDIDSSSPDIFWSPSCTYAEARKMARAHFAALKVKVDGAVEVWVLS